MKKYLILPLILVTFIAQAASAGELHVSPAGNDAHEGSKKKPFKTISAAANVAQPGDVITVHDGIYRERITPRAEGSPTPDGSFTGGQGRAGRG